MSEKHDSIRTGIVGFGLSGRIFHAPLIDATEGFTLTSVVTSRQDDVKSEYTDATVYPTMDAFLAEAAVDLVVIGIPNHLHFDYARQALEAGKHVILEKPFVPDAAAGRKLIEIARSRGLLLSVFHNRRWDGDFRTVRTLLHRGDLGEVVHFESHFDRYKPRVDNRWKEQSQPGSGTFFDLGSHLIDQAIHLFGTPDSITADMTAQRDGATADDYFHVVFTYGRRRVILHGGSLVAYPTPRFQLHGTRGSFVKTGLDPQEEALKGGKRPGDDRWGVDAPEAYGRLVTAYEDGPTENRIPTERGAYEEFYEGIHRSLTQGDPPPVTAEEALTVIRAIELAEKSRKEQRTVSWEDPKTQSGDAR